VVDFIFLEMKKIILLIIVSFAVSFLRCQSYDQSLMLHGDDKAISGRVLEVIPDSFIRFETIDGKCYSFPLNKVKRVTSISDEDHPNLESFTTRGRWVLSAETDLSALAYHAKIEFPNGESNSQKVRSISFRPAAGYMLADNLLVSGFLDLGYSKVSLNKARSIMLGPSLKFFLGGNIIKPYLSGDLMMGWNYQEYDPLEYYSSEYGSSTYGGYGGYGYGYMPLEVIVKDKKRIFGWALGCGGAIFISQIISLDLEVGYVDTKSSSTGDKFPVSKKRGFAMTGGFSIFL
jgi:hypothetical protein